MRLSLAVAMTAMGVMGSATAFGGQSLEELKARCAALESEVNQGQARPFTIDIECQRTRTYWGKERAAVTLPQIATYTGSANIKGRFRVEPSSFTTNHSSSQECYMYREYTVTTVPETVRLQSCAELTKVSSIPQFCGSREPSSGKPGAVELEPRATGRTISTCANSPRQGE